MIGKLLRAVVAVALLVAAGLIGWRVLGPAEVLEQATGAYPVTGTAPPGVTGKTTMAPLIVAGSIRVYAGARVVKADGPVTAKTMYTPQWSFRRWPERLTGLVAVAATVVTRWSDGELVALDGRTGKVAWRARGGSGGEPATGRTGSAQVWAPPGLHTAGTSVLVREGRRLIARAADDGSQRWTLGLPPGCGDGFVTAGGRYVCGAGAWDVLSGGEVPGWPPGPSNPIGCDVARSSCAGLRDATGQGWLTGGRRPERSEALDAADTTAAGDLVLASSAGSVVASRAGREVWRWAGAAQVLGIRAGQAVLLGADQRLILLDAATGAQRTAFGMYVRDERVEPWKLDQWQLTDGYVAVQRLRSDGTFYTTDPVVIAAT